MLAAKSRCNRKLARNKALRAVDVQADGRRRQMGVRWSELFTYLPTFVDVQAVHEEWIQGGHRVRAVRMLLLYLLYVAVFTLSAVLNSGRNMPHGFHLTK